MNINPKIRLLIRKLFTGKLTKNEIDELNNWYNSIKNEKKVTVFTDTEENRDQIKTRIHSKLMNEIHKEKESEKKSNYNFKKVSGWVTAAAAVVVIALTLIINVQNKKSSDFEISISENQLIERENPNGQKSKLILTDGTIIWLNAASKIKFPEKFDLDTREIHLEGEAFFDVARDEGRPFIIHTKNAVTIVLGTTFNIKSYLAESVQVTVASGKVKVVTGSANSTIKDELLLNSNEQITYQPITGELIRKNVDAGYFLSWKEDVIRFNNTKLSEVATTLERWYDKKITIQNEKLKDCVLVAEYKNEKLYNVLQSLKFTLGIDYEIKENEIIISGKGCN